MKKKQIPLVVLTAIVLSSCNHTTPKPEGSWDGNDYYTKRDSVINGNTYRYSGYGYWYMYSALNGGMVTRFYPATRLFYSLPAATHRTGAFLSSSRHISNGGMVFPGSSFLSGESRGGGFGTTALGEGFGDGHSAAG